MTGPLAQQFAQVRAQIEGTRVVAIDDPEWGLQQHKDALAALSVIERHVQDMASVLDEIWMKPYRAEEIMLRGRPRPGRRRSHHHKTRTAINPDGTRSMRPPTLDELEPFAIILGLAVAIIILLAG